MGTTISGHDACGCEWTTEGRTVIARTCCDDHREQVRGYLLPICMSAELGLIVRPGKLTPADVVWAVWVFWREVGRAVGREASTVGRQLRRFLRGT